MYGETGSISVSEQLLTYPSPNPTTVNWWQVRVNVGLGEGLVGSCPDTDIDLRNHLVRISIVIQQLNWHQLGTFRGSTWCFQTFYESVSFWIWTNSTLEKYPCCLETISEKPTNFSLNVGLEEDKTSHSFLLRVVFLPSISSTQVFGVTWHEIIMELFGVWFHFSILKG